MGIEMEACLLALWALLCLALTVDLMRWIARYARVLPLSRRIIRRGKEADHA